jgi:hypothetical protein
MTEQHVPVERLAAYAAGDVDATAAVEVEAHVALCADCRSDVDAVRRATAALAGLPPVTMPADVAARVDAAVAEADRATGPVGDVLPMTSRKRSRPSFAGIAAAAACLALVGAITVPLVSGGGGGSAERGARDLAAGAPERAVETKQVSSGLNYTSKTVATTLARAAGAPTDAVLSFRTSGSPVAAQPNSAPRADAGSSSPESEASGGQPAAAVPPPPAAGLGALRQDAGRLGACLASLAASQPNGLGTTPLLVDFARFNGDPALVVVFPTVSRGAVTPDRVDVWIVGPRCGLRSGDDDVLVFERTARPRGL